MYYINIIGNKYTIRFFCEENSILHFSRWQENESDVNKHIWSKEHNI